MLSPENSPLPSQGSPVLPVRYPAAELLKQLERDYGPQGERMNFGNLLVPLCRDAAAGIPAGLALTLGEFREVLHRIASFEFVDKVISDRDGALKELIDLLKNPVP
jgi:hypothetical protein